MNDEVVALIPGLVQYHSVIGLVVTGCCKGIGHFGMGVYFDLFFFLSSFSFSGFFLFASSSNFFSSSFSTFCASASALLESTWVCQFWQLMIWELFQIAAKSCAACSGVDPLLTRGSLWVV